MSNDRNIQYTGKDFSSLKAQLIEFAKNYFPDSYTDFTATSPGMMFMEMAAYVGDILSFYQDIQLQETFLQYAKNPSNLYSIAYMMGYKPKATTVASTNLTVSQIVTASRFNATYIPKWNAAYSLAEGSQVISSTSGSVSFLTKNPVDFRYSSSIDPTDVSIYSLDDSGNPSHFLLSKTVEAYSGEIKTTEFVFDSYKKYQTVSLVGNNIVGILDVVDSEGNTWYEVPFLGQDTVFVDSKNTNADANQAPYVLTLRKVPRRFTTRFISSNTLQLQFGAGMYADDADEKDYLPSPTSLSVSQELSRDRFDVAYDPSNFLFSKSYGLAPVNTTLTVRYITGGGVTNNVEAYTLSKPGTLNVTTESGSVDTSTLLFYNAEAASGGRDGDQLEEIRQNALRSFAEQKRMVTLNDFNVRALALPPRYGSVAKVYAANETIVGSNNVSVLNQNPLAISLYVLGYDFNGKLTNISNTLKQNLKTYLSEYLMLTDAIDIKDAFVINIGVKYDVIIKPNYNSSDVLLKCTQVVQDYLKTESRSINETINLSNLYTLLDQVTGVQTVKSIIIENKCGGNYSNYSYDVLAATRNNVVYPSYDISIFEIKYPNIDIQGRVTTL